MTDLNDNIVYDPDKLILCDCNGTLFLASMIQEDGTYKTEVVNYKLLNFLKVAQENGYQVVIVSNDPNGNQSNLEMVCLRAFGRPDVFGQVQDKGEFQRVKAFIVFDDNFLGAPGIVKSYNKLDPGDGKVIDFLIAEFTQDKARFSPPTPQP